jgi:hypothetical protein
MQLGAVGLVRERNIWAGRPTATPVAVVCQVVCQAPRQVSTEMYMHRTRTCVSIADEEPGAGKGGLCQGDQQVCYCSEHKQDDLSPREPLSPVTLT